VCNVLSSCDLVEAEGLAHGALDVERLDVLPVLLEERHEEVDSQVDVGKELSLGHLHVANGNSEAESLLELELDLALELIALLEDVVRVGEEGGELASLVKTGSQQTRDLLDERVGSEEHVVLLGKLLDRLLVLVELLQVLHSHEGHAGSLCLVAMLLVTQDADLAVGARHVGELDGAAETLVARGIVVLEANLQLHRLGELAVGFLGGVENRLDGLAECVTGKLAMFGCFACKNARVEKMFGMLVPFSLLCY